MRAMSHAAPSPPPSRSEEPQKKPVRRPPPKLTTKQVCILRGDGHHLNPVVLIGKDGVTPGLCAAMGEALDSHGLIKIKVSENAPGERRELVAELANRLCAALVQVMGRTALLYRERPKLEAERPPARAKASKEPRGAKAQAQGRSRSTAGTGRTGERGRAGQGRGNRADAGRGAGREASRRGPTSRR
jgi:RNA-binding protein